jgi:hypothetical protein
MLFFFCLSSSSHNCVKVPFLNIFASPLLLRPGRDLSRAQVMLVEAGGLAGVGIDSPSPSLGGLMADCIKSFNRRSPLGAIALV